MTLPQATDLKTCPYCAEQIQAAARLCKYCRATFDLDGRAHPPSTGAAPGHAGPQWSPPAPAGVAGSPRWIAATAVGGIGLLMFVVVLLQHDFQSRRIIPAVLLAAAALGLGFAAATRHLARPAFIAAGLLLAADALVRDAAAPGPRVLAALLLVAAVGLAWWSLELRGLRPVYAVENLVTSGAMLLWAVAHLLHTSTFGSGPDSFGIGGLFDRANPVVALLALLLLAAPAVAALLLRGDRLLGLVVGWLVAVAPLALALVGDSSYAPRAAGMYVMWLAALAGVVALVLTLRARSSARTHEEVPA